MHAKALLCARRQHHLGAQHAHQFTPFNREAIGHGDHQGISFGRAHHGEANAGVAAGRLDHRLAGLQITGALSLFNDLYRKPIFHRRQRVEMLSLDVGPNAIRCQIINAGARRIADGVQDTIVELAAAIGRSSIILSRHYFSLFLSADPCRHANTSKG
jgi:hypothetical protein